MKSRPKKKISARDQARSEPRTPKLHNQPEKGMNWRRSRVSAKDVNPQKTPTAINSRLLTSRSGAQRNVKTVWSRRQDSAFNATQYQRIPTDKTRVTLSQRVDTWRNHVARARAIGALIETQSVKAGAGPGISSNRPTVLNQSSARQSRHTANSICSTGNAYLSLARIFMKSNRHRRVRRRFCQAVVYGRFSSSS
jgi:hypothetical protein